MKKYIAIPCLLSILAAPALAFASCGKAEEEPAPAQVESILTEAPVEESTASEFVPPVTAEPVVAQYVMITTDGLNVRTGAGKNYSPLGSVEKNILMKYAGKTDGWYETRYLGTRAYVSASYAKPVSLKTGDEKAERVIEEGLNVLGAPYVYGATRLHDGKGNMIKGFNDKKFDCSSLMQFMFYRGAGILLNTTTRTQISQGKAVEGELQRGDLMFFTNASRKNNTGLERVGHVALYLGDNYILHTASDYAKIEQISPLRWSYYISARRMF